MKLPAEASPDKDRPKSARDPIRLLALCHWTPWLHHPAFGLEESTKPKMDWSSVSDCSCSNTAVVLQCVLTPKTQRQKCVHINLQVYRSLPAWACALKNMC